LRDRETFRNPFDNTEKVTIEWTPKGFLIVHAFNTMQDDTRSAKLDTVEELIEWLRVQASVDEIRDIIKKRREYHENFLQGEVRSDQSKP